MGLWGRNRGWGGRGACEGVELGVQVGVGGMGRDGEGGERG